MRVTGVQTCALPICYTFHENINRLEKLYTNLLQSYNKSLVLNHF
jgi:hypothetical protein